MTMMKRAGAGMALALMVSACQLPPPAVADISQDKVVIHALSDDAKAMPGIKGEAEQACSVYSRRAVLLSRRTVTSGYLFLFACQPDAGAAMDAEVIRKSHERQPGS
jgi:hypothetical protein